MKIAVSTDDDFLYQKIFLILGKAEEVLRYSSEVDYYDLLLTDGKVETIARAVRMSRDGSADLTVPFTESELKEAVYRDTSCAPLLVIGERCVFLRGKKISLTELEFSLFSILYEAKGEYLSREQLHRSVFGDGYTDGILNVYVHYLREKLECEDEKIILSSRKHGYKLNERYI